MSCKKLGEPAKYMLPSAIGCKDHDVRKKCEPCYTMGARLDTVPKGVGPGPSKYKPENITRFGIVPAEGYMGSLNKSPKPGNPATLYELPPVDGTKNRAPHFGFGNKIHDKVYNIVPAPGDMPLSNVVKPKAPEYSLGIKPNNIHVTNVPAPNHYLPETVDKRLPIEILPRRDLNFTTEAPAPNTYDLMAFKPGRSRPVYSMGVRHSECRMPIIVPGDNFYE